MYICIYYNYILKIICIRLYNIGNFPIATRPFDDFWPGIPAKWLVNHISDVSLVIVGSFETR